MAGDQQKCDSKVRITQPTCGPEPERLAGNTTEMDTGEIQSSPVSASLSTVAPMESKHAHQTQDGQLRQPVPLTHQVYIGAILIIPALLILLAELARALLTLLVALTRPMGNPSSKIAAQTSITVNNLQEELHRHSQLLKNHSAMNQIMGGSPSGLTSIGFHGETLVTILIVLSIMALTVYAALQCLKKGLLCPSFLTHLDTDRHSRRNDDDNHTRIRPIYPDLLQMTTMPPQAPKMAILPGEHVQGKCWTALMDNFANRYEGDVPKFHAPIPAVFQSPANRPSFVVPPASEKSG